MRHLNGLRTLGVLALAGLVLCCCASGPPVSALESEAEQLASEAERSYARGDIPLAVENWRAALELLHLVQTSYESQTLSAGFSPAEVVTAGVKAAMIAYERALVLLQLAECYREIGEVRQAEQARGSAAELMAEQGVAPDDVRAPWLLLGSARRQMAMGMLDSAEGSAQRALRSAIGSYAAHGTERAARDAAEALILLAKLRQRLGDHLSAYGHLSDALAWAYDASDDGLTADVLVGLAHYDTVTGYLLWAEVSLLRAVAIYEDRADLRGLSIAYSRLASLKALEAKGHEAVLWFARALEAAGAVGDGTFAALMSLECARLALLMDDCSRVSDCALQGLVQCRQAFCSTELLLGLNVLAAYGHEGLGQVEEALQHYRVVVALQEVTRGHLSGAASKLSYMRSTLYAYRRIVPILAQEGHTDEALLYAEMSKARVLADMVETGIGFTSEHLPPAASGETDGSRSLLGDPESGWLYPDALPGPEHAGASEAQRERRAHLALGDYRRFLTELEARYPVLTATMSVDVERLGSRVRDVREAIGETTLLLEYFVTADETLLWVITRDGIQAVHRIPVPRADLASQVRRFRDELNTVPKPGEEATRLFKVLELGQSLYDLLVAPVEAHLPENGHLVIVPSDVLFYVPYGALYRCPGCTEARGGKYLIELYTLSYAPSLASLYWPLQRRGDGTYNSILSVGADPDPKQPLPESVNEATTVASLFPRGDLLVEEEATEAQVKGLLEGTDYDVVHISTHGRFDQEIPLVSYVQLLPGGGEDGNLHAGELLGLALGRTLTDGSWAGCKLVVLSACQTALPPDIEEALVVGDELQGLSQALFVAGTPSAVLTLWNVNDRSTSVLMAGAGEDLGFYDHLMGGKMKAEALRQAQLLLLRDPLYRHPYYWAAFVLYGDWR